MTVERLLEVAEAIIRAADCCFLMTQGEDGTITSRVMQPFPPEEGLTIWFGTSPKSRKVREIRRDNRVTLGFYDPQDKAYVVLLGTIRLEDDLVLRRTYWREDWRPFFPAGPEGDDYLLMQFVPMRIELMHFAQNVAPEPYGLMPASLVRKESGWVVEKA